ncbi:MAG: CRISPR-associated endoribonuclease Cas6 [Cyclobacteriaceae bacterium]|nr:CRISPR-associated endoribonuclease Cas6 [Cyclobacteriaceae bacterium]MCH8515411.1 CRISPR-associated endoribonuclease Cas6 [Cyclobacteriaceae bacterium]
MRFEIHLRKMGRSSILPINYQYELSSAIYKIISQANEEFAAFLHQKGWQIEWKKFKHFCFSHLQFERFKIHKEAGRIEDQGELTSFKINFVIDQAAEEFIKGLFMNQRLSIGDKYSQVDYEVASISACEPPIFQETMYYKTLSPLLVIRKRWDSDRGEDYLRPDEDGYAAILINTLQSKLGSIAVAGMDQNKVADLIDTKFSALGPIRKKGVTIKQHTAAQSKKIGYEFQFELTAPVELHEIGYYSGFGNECSQGFGCVEVNELLNIYSKA